MQAWIAMKKKCNNNRTDTGHKALFQILPQWAMMLDRFPVFVRKLEKKVSPTIDHEDGRLSNKKNLLNGH